jgi:hypothetical protein
MKLTAADRNLVYIISQAFPPALKGDPPPAAMDWESVVARAERQMLTPLLFDSVKKIDRLRELPPPVLLDIRRNYLRSANHSEENFRELAVLLDALDEARIPVILLKGAALAIALYDRIIQRPMCDLDLLIPKDALPSFIEIIRDRGFVDNRNLGKGFEQEFGTEACFIRPDASRLVVEPHWHVFNSPYYAKKIPVEWFWQHTAPIDIRGRQAKMLSPTAALLHQAVHFYAHHTETGLLPLYDIARLLTRWRDRIDWDDLMGTARAFGLLWVVQDVLRDLSEIWQVSLPAQISAAADAAGGIRTVDIHARSRYVHHVEDFGSVAGRKARILYLWKLLFPSKLYLRQRYGMRDDRLAVVFYGYRMIRCLAGILGLLPAFLRRKRVLPKPG